VRAATLFTSVVLAALSARVAAAPTIYLDETAFLNDLTALGYVAVHEGFEDDAAWGAVRSPATAPTVSSQGATWSANNLSSEVTADSDRALTGDWGFYSIPHGSYANPDPGAICFTAGECSDGFRATANTGAFIAHGGWIETNPPSAKLGMFLGNYPDNPLDLGETCDPPGSENCQGNDILGTESRFFGVIDPVGFNQIEYRELEGKLEPPGVDTKDIFADDFYFAIDDGEKLFSDGFEN